MSDYRWDDDHDDAAERAREWDRADDHERAEERERDRVTRDLPAPSCVTGSYPTDGVPDDGWEREA